VRIHCLLTSVLILAAISPVFGQSVDSLEKRTDIEFAKPDGVSLKLDAYLQKGPGPHPAIVYVHGGGFVSGDKTGMSKHYCDPLVAVGFSVVSLDYRLAPKYPFPAAPNDVQDGIAYIKKNAKSLRIDPDKLVLMGESAGGLLSAYAGANYRPGNKVAAAVPFYGEHDLMIRSTEEPCFMDGRAFPKPKGGCISGGLAAYLGFKELTPENYKILKDASTVAHVHKDMPPFLLIHGTRDYGIPYEQSVQLQQVMQFAGAECDLVAIVGGGHGGWNKPEQQHYKKTMVEWVLAHVDG
jgi:alpha-L-fucosidase 2